MKIIKCPNDGRHLTTIFSDGETRFDIKCPKCGRWFIINKRGGSIEIKELQHQRPSKKGSVVAQNRDIKSSM